MTEKSQTFWSSMPGILTGVAAMITALTGLYLAVSGNNTPQSASTPSVVAESPPITQPENSNPTQDAGTTTPSTTATLERRPAITTAPAIARLQTLNQKPFPTTGPLVDCSRFSTVNTVTSLMSWSNHYHQKIIAAEGSKRAATDPCNKTIDYRGMAHCKAPDNREIRQKLLETLKLCRAAGIEWQNIKHTTIIGN